VTPRTDYIAFSKTSYKKPSPKIVWSTVWILLLKKCGL